MTFDLCQNFCLVFICQIFLNCCLCSRRLLLELSLLFLLIFLKPLYFSRYSRFLFFILLLFFFNWLGFFYFFFLKCNIRLLGCCQLFRLRWQGLYFFRRLNWLWWQRFCFLGRRFFSAVELALVAKVLLFG